MTAWMRSRSRSLARMLLTCVLTVASLTMSSSAICAFSARPRAGAAPPVLQNAAMRIATVDVPPLARSERSPETPGDQVIATSKVSGAATGARYLVCAAAKRGKSVESALYSCQATYALSNGTIVAAGVAQIGGSAPVTVAVTGGTGAYAGARGMLTSSDGRDTLTLQ
jgi:hypothetical protein